MGQKMSNSQETLSRAQGEEVKKILEKVLGLQRAGSTSLKSSEHAKASSALHVHKAKSFVPEVAAKNVHYVTQPGDFAVTLASKKGSKWAADEDLREHGEFVHLPPRHDMIPLSVQPYYWKTLPKRARAQVQEEHAEFQ